MTPEKQRIAIAEACGWTHIAFDRGWLKAGDGEIQGVIPNYLNDLNAIFYAEQWLWRKDWTLRAVFVDYLSTVNHVIGYKRQSGLDPLDATAAQRAEAFLRTIGKWEED